MPLNILTKQIIHTESLRMSINMGNTPSYNKLNKKKEKYKKDFFLLKIGCKWNKLRSKIIWSQSFSFLIEGKG